MRGNYERIVQSHLECACLMTGVGVNKLKQNGPLLDVLVTLISHSPVRHITAKTWLPNPKATNLGNRQSATISIQKKWTGGRRQNNGGKISMESCLFATGGPMSDFSTIWLWTLLDDHEMKETRSNPVFSELNLNNSMTIFPVFQGGRSLFPRLSQQHIYLYDQKSYSLGSHKIEV